MDKAKVKEILQFFRDIDNHIAFNIQQINDMEDDYYPSGGTRDINRGIKSKNKISKTTERTALSISKALTETIQEVKEENELLYRLKAAIIKELGHLPHIHRTVIYDFYVRGHKWVHISKRIKYSERQCRGIRDMALNELGAKFAQNKQIAGYNFPAKRLPPIAAFSC